MNNENEVDELMKDITTNTTIATPDKTARFDWLYDLTNEGNPVIDPDRLKDKYDRLVAAANAVIEDASIQNILKLAEATLPERVEAPCGCVSLDGVWVAFCIGDESDILPRLKSWGSDVL